MALFTQTEPGDARAGQGADARTADARPTPVHAPRREIGAEPAPPERVLVATEDPVFRATAVAALFRAGYLADGVASAEAALEAIRLGVYACGVLDLDLAGRGPAGLVARSRAAAPGLPIVVLTDGVEPEEAIWALRQGAAEVVGKPVTSAGLCAVLRRAIDEAAAAPAPRGARLEVELEDDGDGAFPVPGPPEPPAEASAQVPAQEPHLPAPGGDRWPQAARRRVLVVDDDLILGRSIASLLEPYEVVFAQSAAGALGRVASGRGFAAAVCDFRMPGMDGIQFYAEVEKLDPALARRIVYVTGWADAPEFEAFLRRTSCACLPKPFDPGDLRRAVDDAAERDRA